MENSNPERTLVRVITKTQLRRSITLFDALLERGLGMLFVREHLAFSVEPVQVLNEPGSVTVTTSYFVTTEWYEILALLKTSDAVVVTKRGAPFIVLRQIPVASTEIDSSVISVFDGKGKPSFLESSTEVEIQEVAKPAGVHITGATTAVTEQICRVLRVLEVELKCKISITGQTGSIEIEPHHNDNWAAESEKPSTFLVRVACNAVGGALSHLTLGRCHMVSNQRTGFTDEHLEQAIRKTLIGR